MKNRGCLLLPLMCVIYISLSLVPQLAFSAEGSKVKPNSRIKTNELVEKTIEYKDEEGTSLEGFLVAPTQHEKNHPRPAIIVVHDWMGLGDYSKMRAKQMAEMGYVALAADIYGKGVRAKDPSEAGALAGKYKGNIPLLRKRAMAAFSFLTKYPGVDSQKVIIMGYCFGGTTALELARSGAPLLGAVSFHGGLSTPNANDAKNIKAKILVLHGALDPYVNAKEVADFQNEMNNAKVDYQFISYAGAVHAFTQSHAGSDISKGAAYNEAADKRSFLALTQFLNEVIPLK